MKSTRFKYYSRIYIEQIKNSFTVAFSFRINFFLSILVSLLSICASILTVKLLFYRFDSIAGWDEPTFLFFTIFVLLILELQNTLLTLNYWDLQNLILKGDLDFFLIRPANILFSVFFKMIRINTFAVIPFEVVLLIYYGVQIDLSMMAWCLLPGMIILSLILLALIGILQCCLIFWVYQGSGINYLRLQLANISQWPDQIYGQPFKNILTYIFPVLAIGTLPVRYLLNPNNPKPLLILLIEIIIFTFITSLIWRRALKHYESASS